MLILTFLIDSSQWLSQKKYSRIRFTHEDIEIWKMERPPMLTGW